MAKIKSKTQLKEVDLRKLLHEYWEIIEPAAHQNNRGSTGQSPQVRS